MKTWWVHLAEIKELTLEDGPPGQRWWCAFPSTKEGSEEAQRQIRAECSFASKLMFHFPLYIYIYLLHIHYIDIYIFTVYILSLCEIDFCFSNFHFGMIWVQLVRRSTNHRPASQGWSVWILKTREIPKKNAFKPFFNLGLKDVPHTRRIHVQYIYLHLL